MELKYTQNDNLSFSSKNCAILGSNWAWKSSLCKNLYKLNYTNNVEYIRAQRDLSINQGGLKGLNEDVLEQWLSSYSLVAVWSDLGIAHITSAKVQSNSNNIIQNDFNKNIEKFFRDNQSEHADSSMNHKGWDYKKPVTKADTIFEIWNNIFLDREIKISWWKIKVFIDSWTDSREYDIENLSDGERSALYMITKSIYAKDNSTIIIDEWESHLNPSILYELWDSIEVIRNDCAFIYVSHDINFITSRNNCTRFWIKEFTYPENWVIEEINDDKIPEELILQILGSKKEKILFVESVEDKDKLLYQKIYTDFKVVPLWACDNVIHYTKTLNSLSENYNKQYYWLIDRDFKTNKELELLNTNNIFSIPVAEFENIFFKKEVIEFLFTHLWLQDTFEEKFEFLKKAVFDLKNDTQFKEDFYKNFIIQEFNKNLSVFKLQGTYSFENDYQEANKLWEKIYNEGNYDNFLQLLNAKSIKWKVIQLWLGYWWKIYRDQVLNIFNTDKSDEFKGVFRNFMPKIENN